MLDNIDEGFKKGEIRMFVGRDNVGKCIYKAFDADYEDCHPSIQERLRKRNDPKYQEFLDRGKKKKQPLPPPAG